MAWVVVGLAVVLLAVVCRAARTMTGSSAASTMFRTGMLALAAGIAFVAILLALGDNELHNREITLALLVGACTGSAVLAFAGIRWGRRAGTAVATGAFGATWAATWLITVPGALVLDACGCATPYGYVPPPTFLGMEPRGWIVLAAIAGPCLVLLSASRLPRAREAPREPSM